MQIYLHLFSQLWPGWNHQWARIRRHWQIHHLQLSGGKQPFTSTKQCVGAHSVSYSGTVQWGDLPTLQGQWYLTGRSGGFMLSPERSLQPFSGKWKGYYEQYGSKYKMKCSLAARETGRHQGALPLRPSSADPGAPGDGVRRQDTSSGIFRSMNSCA